MTSTPMAARAVALGTVLLACLLVLLPAPGAVASARTETGDGRATFGVQPSGPKKPDRRSDFSYSATPGAAVRDHIAVLNHSTRPLTLSVYASDAFTTEDGGFDLLARGRKSKDAGTWVTPTKRKVTVPARSRAVVPFTLTVPAKAAPGDHAAGIVAALVSTRTGAKGDRVAVEQRVGARVHIRVAGELKPQLTVEDLHATYHGTANPFGGGSATVTYTVRNTGNVRLGARQTVRVSNAVSGPRTADKVPAVKQLLPGGSVKVTASVHDVFPALRSTATVTVDPVPVGGDIDPALPGTTRSTDFWTVPWALLALLLLIVAGVTAWLLRRRRRARRAAGAASPVPLPSQVKKEKISMLTKRSSRPALVAAASLLAATGGVVLLGAPPAYAETLGKVSVTPATGADDSPMTLTTSGACPATGDHLIVSVAGKGFPAGGQNVVGTSPTAMYPVAGAGYEVPLTSTMRDYASVAGFKTLEGKYEFTVTCRKAFGEATFGDFKGSIWFTSPTEYRDTDPAGPGPSDSGSPTPSSPGESTPPAESESPSASPEPSDTGEPTDTALPTETTDPGTTDGGTGTDGGTSAGSDGSTGGSTDVSTDVKGGGGGVLANTGAQATALSLASLTLIGLGALAVRWARRRGLLTFPNGGNR
ncbi:WxL protein peptidoglycan domain-containing protein [Streptomyces sp. NPDC058001]|uniref:WxL protein peptidoglycan domain-containing protein n=1 Tax=Streptomyces sp. NPDC058001 TaxID=3346300 RepID=UPI0036E6DB04